MGQVDKNYGPGLVLMGLISFDPLHAYGIRLLAKEKESGDIEEREKEKMASVVRGVLKAIKEKGVGGFFRDVRNEGYLYDEFPLLIYRF